MRIPKIRAKKTIPYNFSEKHLEYIRKCRDSTINVAEGAVRAGKTVDNVIGFCRALEKSRDFLHLATAATAATAKTVIGDCNGFGVAYYFRGQCRWGQYKGNEALIIQGKSTGYRQRVLIFVGGAKKNSYEKFRGMSIGMWIATEINLHHDNTIKEAFNRQLAAQDRKIFWDLNPSQPQAPIYRDYIDAYAKQAAEGKLAFGYNYQKFTIFDNINISESKRKEIISQYCPGTVWYRRDILGERTAAEGLIFRIFADDPGRFTAESYPQAMRMITIGVDFGGNKSKTTFVATGFIGNFQRICVLADYKVPGEKGTIDTALVCKKLLEFYRYIRSLFPVTPIYAIYCDSAEQMIINTIRGFMRKNGISTPVKDSYKGAVNDRIYALNALMSQGRFSVYRDCENVIGSLREQVWDDSEIGEDVRLDNGTCDIDTADALEYSFSSFIKALNINA
ncbi:MAG: PBSX family phage terminase large subunit [Huintestinicola sp.]